MEYNEKLLNVKESHKKHKSSNENKNINENNIEIGYNKADAFHDSNIFSKLFFCWVNPIFKVKKYYV